MSVTPDTIIRGVVVGMIAVAAALWCGAPPDAAGCVSGLAACAAMPEIFS